ncbi:MAG: Na/Pi symporter [Bacteroidia bacterium]|nr:Na/Pi symporter [Bacteroidia bacterium]
MPEPKRHTFTVGGGDSAPEASAGKSRRQRILWVLRFVLTLLVFLLALEWMSLGLRLFGKDKLQDLISLIDNPYLALFLGILATSIIQSSSTVTTMIVGLVANGTFNIASATPLIMGANIGTSVTCMIVAMGLIGQRKEFGRGVTTAALHGIFNILVVAILFPLELTTHALSRLSDSLASLFYQGSEVVPFSPGGLLDITTRPLAAFFVELTSSTGFPHGNPYIVLPLGLVALFLALRLLITSFQGLVEGQVNSRMNQYLFGHPRQAFFTGLITTTVLQSSSVTTSLLVPLTSGTHIALPRIFAFLIGANMGTTVTALLAAIFLGPSSEFALAIAFTHLLFNCIGGLLLYPMPLIRKLPIWLASKLGKSARDHRFIPVIYMVIIYFLLPGILIFAT